jgi:hypothetical protein
MLIGCLTHSYLNYKYGVYAKLDDLYRMTRGNAIHRKLQWNYRKKEVLISHDFDGVTVWGTIDAIDDDDRINEFKTSTWLPKQPYPHHVKQVSAYDTILDLEGNPASGCKLVYVSMQGIRSFTIEPVDMRSWIMSRAGILGDGLRKGLCPLPNLESDEEWRRKYCDFRSVCGSRCVGASDTNAISLQTPRMDRGVLNGILLSTGKTDLR